MTALDLSARTTGGTSAHGLAHDTLASRQRHLTAIAWPVVFFVAALLICAARIGHQPEFDELYHVLAARGWLETGRFAIAEGEYNRTGLFTLLIAAFFRLFGESLAVARIPSVLAYAILVPVFFVWMRRRTSPLAAWVASVVLLCSPFIVELATFIRFYAIQVTSFVVAVILIQTTLADRPGIRRGSIRLVAAAALLVVASYLQVVTLIGIAGLVLWLVLELLGPWYLARSRGVKLFWLVVALAVLAGAVLLLIQSGIGAPMLQRFRSVPEFQEDTVNQFWFYHFWLVLYYPLLWVGFPILLLASLAAYPQVARLCGSIFIVGFLVNSFAGSKDTRYLAYAFPFLFALFGMGIAALWPGLRAWIRGTLWRIFPPPVSARARSGWEAAVLALAVLFVVLANGATPRFVTMLAGIRLPPQPPLVNWRAAEPELRPWLAASDVVVTNDELAALYYLGAYDVLIYPSRLSELPDKTEFARDPRTGRPVIATPAALQAIFDCFKTGLVVLDRVRLSSARPGVAEFLAKELRPLPLPRAWSVDAYVWDHEPSAPDQGFCQSIVQRQRNPARLAP
jgi:4-amino-4-deoxy-L-arabinose transferase-like glycosyltransferase